MFATGDICRYLRFSKDVVQMYENRVAAAATDCGLTKPEADILLFLANTPQLDTARDMCEYRNFSKAYVSKAVELLCARDFLCAAVEPSDRRVQHLRMLPAAQVVAARLQAAQKAFFELITDDLSEEDERVILSVLSRISANVLRAKEE